MRAFNQGAFVRVTVSANEVSNFARRWPCFGKQRSISFMFGRNGDLVDMTNTEGMNEDGLLALSQDAESYARSRYIMG